MAGQPPSWVINSEEAADIRKSLADMAKDVTFNTTSTYSANIKDYPDHLIPFVEKHMAYLSKHPKLNPQQYLAKLRLMNRIRR